MSDQYLMQRAVPAACTEKPAVPDLDQIERIICKAETVAAETQAADTAAENRAADTATEQVQPDNSPSECTDDAGSWSEWLSPACDDEEVSVEEKSCSISPERTPWLPCKEESEEELDPVKEEKREPVAIEEASAAAKPKPTAVKSGPTRCTVKQEVTAVPKTKQPRWRNGFPSAAKKRAKVVN